MYHVARRQRAVDKLGCRLRVLGVRSSPWSVLFTLVHLVQGYLLVASNGVRHTYKSCQDMSGSEQITSELAIFMTSHRQFWEFGFQARLLRRCSSLNNATLIVYNNNPKARVKDIFNLLNSFRGDVLFVHSPHNLGHMFGPVEALAECQSHLANYPMVMHMHPDVLFMNCQKTVQALRVAEQSNQDAIFFVTPIQGKNTIKFLKRTTGAVPPAVSVDWFAYRGKMLGQSPLFQHVLQKTLSKKYGDIFESRLPAVLKTRGIKYSILVERGTRSRGTGCYEDGIGLAHCHSLQIAESMIKSPPPQPQISSD